MGEVTGLKKNSAIMVIPVPKANTEAAQPLLEVN